MAIERKKSGKALQFRRLIRGLRSIPADRPPYDITQQIMQRIAVAERAGTHSSIHRWQSRLQDIWHWQGPTRWHELSACVFAVVISYTMMGAILYGGFAILDVQAMLPYWIKIQAPFSLVTACGFLIIGLYSLKKDRRAVRMARSIIIIHIGVASAITVMMLGMTGEITIIGGLLSFMSVHLILGLFMALAVSRFDKTICNQALNHFCLN